MSYLPVLGVASGLGGPYPNSDNAAALIYRLLFKHESRLGLQPIRWQGLAPKSSGSINSRLTELNLNISYYTNRWTRFGQPFLIVGGDHSCALGVWAGVLSALEPDQNLGLIWLDAHMDAHTFASSPSGHVHGMPIAALLGQADSRLTKIYPGQQFLAPQNLALIGVRSFEAQEAALLRHLQVPIHYCPLANDFIDPLMKTITTLDKNCDKIALSLDLDVIDPQEAPGVATPVSGGINAQELLDGLTLIHQHPKLCGIEISEYYPQADRDDKTLLLIDQIIQCVFSVT